MAEEKPRRKRQANGEARPKLRADGRWQAYSSTFKKYFYGKTEREAKANRVAGVKAAKKAAEEAVKAPPAPPASAELFGDYLERWLNFHAVTKPLEDRSKADYWQRLRDYVIPTLGKVQLGDLTSRVFDDLTAQLLDRGLSKVRVRVTLIVVRQALDQAERWELLTRNVSKRAVLPKAKRGPGKSFTREQVNRLLSAAKAASDQYETLFAFAVATGMRMAELFGVLQEDLNLERAQLTVRRSLYRPKGGGWVLKTTKTDRVRTIPLNDTALAVLKTQRTRQLTQRVKAGPDWQEHGFIFTSGRGTPLMCHNTDVAFHKAMDRVGIAGFRFHDLRHTAGTLMQEAGMSLVEVQRILGHSTITTTANIYSHVADPVLWDKMRQFGDYLEGNGRR